MLLTFHFFLFSMLVLQRCKCNKAQSSDPSRFLAGAAPSFSYGLRRPGPSSPDVPRATGPQGAACRHRRTPAWIEHAQF